METSKDPIQEKYLLSDEHWEQIRPLIPAERSDKKIKGRTRMDDRKALQAIFYVLRTGCQWNALPRSLGASSTVHDRFQQLQKAGFFEQLFEQGLLLYDKKKALSLSGSQRTRPLVKHL